MLSLLGGFILMAIAYRLAGNYSGNFSTAYSYVLLPSRLDGFSVGAVLYLLSIDRKFIQILRKGWIYSTAALLLALFIMLLQQAAWHLDAVVTSHFGYTLNAVFWAGIVGYTTSANNGYAARIFGSGWLMETGKYSYGMYMLHVPIKVILLKLQENNLMAGSLYYLMILLSVVLTIVCSIASYHLLEKKFLRYKK